VRDLPEVANGKPALLIVGHGSRDPRGAEEFHELISLLRKSNPTLPIEGGFIELSRPPISECVSRLVEDDVREISAVPLMLLSAGHAKDDIPATLVREKTSHPEIVFHYGRALGIRPELLALMDEKISRLFYEGRPYPLVEPAFVSLAPPNVPEALKRCKKLGARRIVVFSYFLFTGVLERRIRMQSEEFAAQHSEVEVRYAGYFGPDARVAELVLERYRESFEGDIRMNCDVCVHRVALPGFEEKVGAPATPHYHPGEPGRSHDHHHH
jgi:sirohydrochlorin cobaltochelatase